MYSIRSKFGIVCRRNDLKLITMYVKLHNFMEKLRVCRYILAEKRDIKNNINDFAMHFT